MNLLQREQLNCEGYQIKLIPLDARCNCLRVEMAKGDQGQRFEETIHVHDFIDIKQLIKAGKTIQDISDLSLLFLKLMISSAVTSKKLVILKGKDLPYQKIVKGKDKIGKWIKSGESQEVKALFLQLREDLMLVLPKLLINPPKRCAQIEETEAKEKKIKEIFYGHSF